MLLPLWEYSCSIRARSRNSFTFKIKLVKTPQVTSSRPNLQTYDPQMAQETTSAASFWEILLLHKGEKQKVLHCQKTAKNDRNKVNTTRLTSRLQRCDPKKAKETTSHASFREILLLHKGEKQKLLHFQNKVSKDRDHKLRVKCRTYKHVTHKWHGRQQLLLPLGKNYCSIKARSRNSFTVRMQLDKMETKSTCLTPRLQRCDRQTAEDITFAA